MAAQLFKNVSSLFFRLRRSPRARIAALCLAGAFAGFLLAFLWPMDPARTLAPHPSGEIRDRTGRLLYVFLNDRQQWCFPRALPEISPLLVQATLAAEDRRFRRHHGIDLLAVARAMGQNLLHRRVISGASTLSMQIVKQARNRDSGALSTKALQAFDALRVEQRVSKQAILEAYLNQAPYGLNLVGCEAAARRYFGKSARELTLPEAALLAGLPKSPTRANPLKSWSRALRRRNYVLRRMHEEGYLSNADYLQALRTPIRASWHAFPALAPHLSTRLQDLAAQQDRVATTLDASIQARAERIVAAAVGDGKSGITNAAALIVDVPSASVLAHVGSASFTRGSQVDVTRAPRSPGSALKPFTYALAMERQRLYPNEMLLDDSLDYGLYAPENFDRRFSGLVPAAAALRRSLNVPAVTVLERIGTADLQTFLQGLHLTTLRQSPEHYGLALTLGTCEVRLDELAAAYAMLASLGEYRPLRFLRNSPVSPNFELRTSNFEPAVPVRKLSRDICIALYAMLEQPLPNDGLADAPSAALQSRVCWKTGTSTGRHDAWAIVFNARSLVAVWMGNNDGVPSRRLVGALSALPLAAELFRSLPIDSRPSWPSPGDALRPVQVCALSGLPACRWCPATQQAWFPKSQYLHRTCDMHYPAPASPQLETANSGLKTAPLRVLERWPASPHQWDLARITDVVLRSDSAADNETSASLTRADALRIHAPANRSEIVLTGDGKNADQVLLTTSLDAVTTLSWYLDASYLGASQPFHPLVLPLTAGSHRLTCMTPSGQSATSHFQVLTPESLSEPETQESPTE